MEAVFLGNHPALDFLNTSFTPQGVTVDVITDGESFLRWLAQATLIDGSDVPKMKRLLGGKALDAVAAEARKLRSWATEWIERWSNEPNESYAAELRRLNALLERGRSYHKITQVDGKLELAEREHLQDADELLALIAAQLAKLVTDADPNLVKRCAGTGCTLWFLDTTKGHRRMFCSASACGNRAKVAAFRERQKQS
jgi:predicted RNA-binding Zn ribbon-like protein